MKKLYTIAAALMLTPLFTMGQGACTPVDISSNGFENGNFMEAGGQLLANDFSISAQTTNFALSTLTLNVLTQGGIASLDVIFHDDASGNVGAEISSYSGMVPTSQDTIGAAFGFDVQTVVIDFDTPIDFAGDATYWIQIIANPLVDGTQVAWETTTAQIVGAPVAFDNGAGTWGLVSPPADGVLTINGECTYVSGCLYPENVMITNATPSTLDVMWSAVGSAAQWAVEYGPTGFTPGSGDEVIVDNTPTVTLDNLNPITSYDVYVRSVCGADDESANIGPMTASTGDTYCAITFPNIEPITLVDFAGISNVTSADPATSAAHEYFLDQTAMIEQGGTYPITVEGFSGGDYQNSYVLFIDWNQDNEFNSEDERYEIGYIQNSTGEDGIQATGDIVVPVDAPLGQTRMRVAKVYTTDGTYMLDGCNTEAFSYGQAEDYTVQVDISSGIDFNEYNFSMGPNPTTDFVQFSSSANIQSLSIYNVLGQQLMYQELNQQSPKVDMSRFENGTYLMEVEINNEKKVFKIVKQ